MSQRQVDMNQDLLTKIRRLEEKEERGLQALNEQLEKNKSLKQSLEELQKQVHDKDGKISETHQVQGPHSRDLASVPCPAFVPCPVRSSKCCLLRLFR